MTPEQQLRALLDACERMRVDASYWRQRHTHMVSQEAWSAWSQQVAEAKRFMKSVDNQLSLQ